MRRRLAVLGYIWLAAMLCLSQGAVRAEDATFSEAELDQMLAPIALYPDALLAQILMAATYPADVAEAVQWSKGNPDQEGDAAVEAVQDKPWDPSVMSLVAFPQVLAMMGEQPDWVQNLGDAFLADPDVVMDTVQKLRSKARDEGNLETTEQQKVIVEEASPTETIVIIEPADPQIIYVPTYNPTVVYGTWWWPRYRPWYYYPPGYGFGSAVIRGIGFGIGIRITNALWGGCRWGRGRGGIHINVNRYNKINVNRNRISTNKRNANWKHNSKNRRGVPYRDAKSRDQFEYKRAGADQRRDYRGRDAQRDKARAALDRRGADPAEGRKKLQGAGGDKARASVGKANREVAPTKPSTRDAGRTRDASKGMNRETGRTRDTGKSRDLGSGKTRSRDTALRGSGSGNKTRQQIDRGNRSSRAMQSRGGGGGRR